MLTRIAAFALAPPAAGQVDYFDPALPGFSLRVTSKGCSSSSDAERVSGAIVRNLTAEAGFGVRNAGSISASAGPLVIDANGWDPRDDPVLALIPENAPVILALNKVDKVGDKATEKAGEKIQEKASR